MSIFFNGRLLTTPAVESAIYDQGLATAHPGRAGNIACILGTSEGGAPKTALFFDSPVVARRTLRGGDLLTAVEMAFNPSAETGSPARVAVIRVEPAVQATLMLKDAATNSVIKLDSVDYGAHTNGIKVTVAAGTTSGKHLTVQQGENYFTRDNISRTPLSIRYSGVEATATATVTASALTLKAPSGGTGTVLTLANYASVRALCDAINAVPGFSSIALIPGDPVVATLDGLVATTCKAVDLAVTADLQAAVTWFNTTTRDLVFATRRDGALAAPAALTGTYLAGGTNGTAPTNDDWQDAFDALQGSDVQYVVPLSASDAIHAMADAHVAFMSGAGKMERRAFVGGDVVSGTLDSAIAAAKVAAMALNSDRTALCFPPILGYDDSGALVALPAYFLAAQVAGGFSAMNPGHTMTNKVLTVPGLDPLVTRLYDSDTLIDAGVLGARQTRRGFIISKAISTWLANDNYNRVELSTGIALDFVARTVREALEIFVGRKASPVTLHEAISTVETVLRDLARPEPVGVGVIVGDAANPAYRNITAEIEGDVLRVWFECSPVIPINFVLVGIYARAYSGTATVANNV
ncbi:hypothetical protein [uncultured Thiodictyon sp.]|uniref:hypothetical protein n=1 Tax=uncultured Thiodictyon sp. TaxID=1846217 RepID=UPI0025DDCC95|nr:hypothetical protein [uncultured Thiodictyon sp.]